MPVARWLRHLMPSRGCPAARPHHQLGSAIAWLALLLAGLSGSSAQPAGGGGDAAPGEGDLRLVEGAAGPGFEYGRLEIFRGGRWGNVCQGGTFTPDSAQVACRQLGYDGGARLDWLLPYSFGFERSLVLVSTTPVLISDVDCTGSESRLLDCEANTAAEQPCRDEIEPATDLRGIVIGCSNAVTSCNITAAEEEGSVRLQGGFGTPCDPMYTGFVEVFHNNEWGAILETLLGNLAADAVCRQLGFPHGNDLRPFGNPSNAPPPPPPASDYDSYYGSPYMEEAEEPVERVWLRRVECSGREERLVDCDLNRGAIERFGADQFRGRFTVACRQFAVEAALEAVTTPGAEEGDIRLVDQASVDNWVQGRPEVFCEGTWSQVCRFSFDAVDADVACRQLGFGAGTVLSLFGTAAAGPEQDPPVFPEAAVTKAGCNGTEARLIDCPVDPTLSRLLPRTDNRGCFSLNDAGLYIACVAEPLEGIEEGAVRFRNEMEADGVVSGVLEIFHAGAWGTICDGGSNFVEVVSEFTEYVDYYYSGINPSAGSVACQELGFAGGDFEDIAPSSMDDDRSPAWADALLCVGTEERLRDCPGINFGDTVGCEATQRLVCSP